MENESLISRNNLAFSVVSDIQPTGLLSSQMTRLLTGSMVPLAVAPIAAVPRVVSSAPWP